MYFIIFLLLAVNFLFIISQIITRKEQFCCDKCGLLVRHPKNWAYPKLRHQCKSEGNLVYSLTTIDTFWSKSNSDEKQDPPPI